MDEFVGVNFAEIGPRIGPSQNIHEKFYPKFAHKRKTTKKGQKLKPLTWEFGGPTRIRTENQRIMSPLLHR